LFLQCIAVAAISRALLPGHNFLHVPTSAIQKASSLLIAGLCCFCWHDQGGLTVIIYTESKNKCHFTFVHSYGNSLLIYYVECMRNLLTSTLLPLVAVKEFWTFVNIMKECLIVEVDWH